MEWEPENGQTMLRKERGWGEKVREGKKNLRRPHLFTLFSDISKVRNTNPAPQKKGTLDGYKLAFPSEGASDNQV